MTDQIQDLLPDNRRMSLLIEKVAGIDPAEPDWQINLQDWVANHPAKWWQGVWIACEIKGDPGQIISPQIANSADLSQMFVNARLNVAENLLGSGPRLDHALTCWAEDGPRQRWSRANLKEISGRFASGFAELGLTAGDQVVIDLPNVPEKLAAFLGASWIGLTSIFHQPWQTQDSLKEDPWEALSPSLVLSCDGYRRGGAWVDCASKITRIAQKYRGKIPVIPVPCAGSKSDIQNLDNIMPWLNFERLGKGGGRSYRYVNFAHELAKIPNEKAIGYHSVSSGNWLLPTMYRWRLQSDIGPGAHCFFIGADDENDWLSSISALAVGSDIVLYDGSAKAMNKQVFWRIIEREKAKVIEVNAKQIAMLKKLDNGPIENHFLRCVEVVIVNGKLSVNDFRFLQEKCFQKAKIIEACGNMHGAIIV